MKLENMKEEKCQTYQWLQNQISANEKYRKE